MISAEVAARAPSISAAPGSALPHRRDIDGLRCVAVTAVVFYHAGLWPLSSGYVGVDIFFVISGFLIGGILNREIRGGNFSFSRFYARRAKRILPALFAVTLFVCLAAPLVMGARELRQTGISAASALVGVSNFYFWWETNYFSPDAHLNPFLMTWSLGVEEQFYLFFPLVLIVLGRWSAKVTLAALAILSVVSAVVCILVTARNPTMAFYLLPMRAWELGAGALLALTAQHFPIRARQREHEILGWAGLIAILAACMVFSDSTPFPGSAAILPVIGTMALLFADRSWVNRRLLSAPLMVFIGLLSYSWYLWHAPLMALTRLAAFGEASTWMLGGVAIVALGCAYLSWRFIEQPFRLSKAPSRSMLLRYGMALCVAIALSIALVKLDRFVPRLSPDANAVENMIAGGRSNPCLLGYGETVPRTQGGCRGVDPQQRHIVLLGDSHAAALGGGLAKIASGQGLVLDQYEKSSCLPLLGASRAMIRYPQHAAECATFNKSVFDAVAADPLVKTVVLAGFWSAPFQGPTPDSRLVSGGTVTASSQLSLLDAALRDTIARYKAAGKDVVILADVPLFTFDPGKEALTDKLPVRDALRSTLGMPGDVANGRASRRWLRPQTAADDVVRHAAVEAGARFHDPAINLCDQSGCLYGSELPFYLDFQHLTHPGALYALRGLRL